MPDVTYKLLLKYELLWLLCGVGMLRAGIYFKLHADLLAQRCLGQHTLHGVFDNTIGTGIDEFAELLETCATRIKSIAVIFFLLHTLTGHFDLAGIDHDDKIAGIDVG